MRALLVPSLLVLAACPQKRGAPGPGAAAGPGLGCPAASGVHIASYLTPEDAGGAGSGSAATPGGAGHTGWVLPLHDRVVDSLDGVPAYQPIDAAAASAAGVPAPPRAVWLLSPQAGPCRATIGSYYAAAIDGPPPNITYGVELSGCPAPPDATDASAIVLAYDAAAVPEGAAPTDCKVAAPRLVAARLGEPDKDGRWQRPVKETPIPPALARVVPEKPCAAPACEKLWSIAQVDVGGEPVAWAGAVNWLAIPPGDGPEKQCEWRAETFSGFFVPGPDGAPVRVSEGQERPLLLSAVLADAGGAKVLIASGPGEYATYDLGGGGARLGRHLVWLRASPESYGAIDQIGPDCGM